MTTHAKSSHAPIEGSCLCGNLRYEVAGPLSRMIHCHCSMCRKHHGAPFATFVGAPLMGFKWYSGEDSSVCYRSSEQGVRRFCPTCGSAAPALIKQMDLAVLPAANLSGEIGIRPQSHLFVGSKAPWYTIRDDLPQHEEYPPEFGLVGVARPIIEAKEGVVAGSCLCGEVAYEMSGPPKLMVNCYCSRCRRGRSAAHATNLLYRQEDFRYTRGETETTTYRIPDAKFGALTFCRHCGSGVARVSAERGLVIVPAGGLDTDPGVRPMMHIHVASKAAWVDIHDDLPQFEASPPS
jgi:hypothetical protein